MRFLNYSKPARDRIKNRRTTHRRLGGESLEPRLMLSNDPPGLGSTHSGQEDAFVVAGGLNLEPMATIALENAVLKVNGTNSDDKIEINHSFFFYQVDINTVLKFHAIEATLRDAEGNVLSTGKFYLHQVNEIIVNAFDGDDTVSNSTSLPSQMFGGAGNDNLYGGFGADIIWGEDGLDGLFGGDNIVPDDLHGGSGADRYLVRPGNFDTIHDVDSHLLISFYDGPGDTVDLEGFQEDATFEPGAWTRNEIVLVDQALNELHHTTGNFKLLKAGAYAPISFIRHGAQTSGPAVRGWNNSGQIKLVDSAFTSGQDRLTQIVMHEVGHNWDQENPFWNEFLALSGWVEASSAPSPNHVPGTSEEPTDQWYFDSSATFAREYGKQNPNEDFATSFAAYFVDQMGLLYEGYGAANIPEKVWLIRKFVNSISEKSLSYAPVTGGIAAVNSAGNNQQIFKQLVQRRESVAAKIQSPIETATSFSSNRIPDDPQRDTRVADSSLAVRDAAFAEWGESLGNEVGRVVKSIAFRL